MRALWNSILQRPTMAFGAVLIGALFFIALFAPWLGTVDPSALSPVHRTRPPSERFWFGTDLLGRDVYSRVIYGTRVSLTVGLLVALFSAAIGTIIGLCTGFFRMADAIVMRVIDGLMAIPTILLAIALISVTQASLTNVIIIMTVAEIPRVVRLIRGQVLTLREQPFVEAAVAADASIPRIIFRHVFPNTIAPLTVQATYICGVAILAEASLSFLGLGVPTSTPSWGNIMAEGRAYWQIRPNLIAYPAIFLSITVLAVNMLGDGLRDALDPRMAKRI
jgi:peptide/nickel transport system permease protein